MVDAPIPKDNPFRIAHFQYPSISQFWGVWRVHCGTRSGRPVRPSRATLPAPKPITRARATRPGRGTNDPRLPSAAPTTAPLIRVVAEKSTDLATKRPATWFRSTSELAIPETAFGPQGKVCCATAASMAQTTLVATSTPGTRELSKIRSLVPLRGAAVHVANLRRAEAGNVIDYVVATPNQATVHAREPTIDGWRACGRDDADARRAASSEGSAAGTTCSMSGTFCRNLRLSR